MQRFTTYGFIMDYDDSDKNKYLELKDAIERLCRSSELNSKKYDKNPLIHYFPIKKGVSATCCVINGEAQFGIYDSRKDKKIIQYLSNESSINLNTKTIQNLIDRIEILAMYSQNVKFGPLQQLWLDLFKEKEMISNKINDIEK